MAKPRGFDIAVLNLSIHPHSAAKYVDLIQRAARFRNPAKVRGEYQAMIGSARDIEDGKPEKGITGEIYKFFELDPQTNWFNLIRQKAADPTERSRIQIPPELKPHFSLFNYVFFPRGHRFFFETRYAQNRLSPTATAKMLETSFRRPAVLRGFGPVDVTVEPSAETLDRILKMPTLRRLRIELTRPNADDLGSARRKVMERLEAMNAERQAVELAAQKHKSLQPDAEIRSLARVAQSNGHVEADGYGDNGKPTYESTKQHPLIEKVTYDPDIETHRDRLIEKSAEMMMQISNRERAEDDNG